MSSTRRLILAAWLAVLILIILALLWEYSGNFYNQALAVLAQPLGAPAVAIRAEGAELILNYPGVRRVVIHGLTLQWGALLAISLMLATPACAWRKKVIAAVTTAIGFLALATIAVAAMSWGLAGTVEGGTISLSLVGPVMPLVYIGLPALVGAAWCAKYWLPVLTPPKSVPPKSRGTAGSIRGKKS